MARRLSKQGIHKFVPSISGSVTIQKKFGPYPAAHRQPFHDGHCSFIHGHNWYVALTFCSNGLYPKGSDENGFIADFGKMKPIKDWLTAFLDHTLILSSEDKETLDAVHRYADVRLVPPDCCSCEGMAAYIFKELNALLERQTVAAQANPSGKKEGPVRPPFRIISVTVWEDDKNSATCTNAR